MHRHVFTFNFSKINRMKKYILIYLFILIFSSCEDENFDPEITEFTFNYNIHVSLNSEYVQEFNIIFDNLQNLIPIQKNSYFNNLDVYAWNSKVDKPYKNKIGNYTGACICGNNMSRFMVLEIPDDEFKYNSNHRFSVIAHEYFHVYQMSLSKQFYDGNIELKWMSEGGAASFESIYIQEFYSSNYFLEAQDRVHESVINNPKIFETYDASGDEDINYASSVFMFLVLSKELQKMNYTEEEAFRMIFKDFWLQNPNENNWKEKFSELFGFSVNTFYNNLKDYSPQIENVLPSNTLKIKNIFN